MKTVKIYFQCVTPESAENGDFSRRGEHDEIEVETVNDALDAIKDYGYLEASSSEFHPSIWYTTTDSNENYKTGEHTNYTLHLNGFTEFEEKSIYTNLMKQFNV